PAFTPKTRLVSLFHSITSLSRQNKFPGAQFSICLQRGCPQAAPFPVFPIRPARIHPCRLRTAGTPSRPAAPRTPCRAQRRCPDRSPTDRRYNRIPCIHTYSQELLLSFN